MYVYSLAEQFEHFWEVKLVSRKKVNDYVSLLVTEAEVIVHNVNIDSLLYFYSMDKNTIKIFLHFS